MASTIEIKNKVEPWFREYLKEERYPNHLVSQENVDLMWGGKFQYDAVIKNKETDEIVAVYCLSVSKYLTSGGKPGAGKIHKIRGDVLMMVGTDCPKKTLSFTEKCLFDKINEAQKKGRIPKSITLEHLNLQEENPELHEIIETMRKKSEVENKPK